jgi:hypothetical protein
VAELERDVRKVEERLDRELRDLKEVVERQKGTATVGEVSKRGNVMMPMGAEGGPSGKVKWVVLTDSNRRDIGPDIIKAHISKYQRDGFNIRVEVVYTLMEAYYRLGRGSLNV